MRGRRRGLGLGNYTLGDRYITPDRRLSQSLIQQGSRGGPSNSWQETMGRIAQQLAGAYIGYKDQQNRNVANQAFAKVEPDSFRPPTDAEAMATPGMRDLELSAMTGIAGDGRGQTVTAPLPDDQLMGQGNIPDIMEKIGRYNQNMGKPGALGDEILQQGLDLQTQKFNQEMNQSRQASNVPRPRDFKAELAQGMQGYQQDPSNRVMNEKMPQIEYAMQNLRGLENNPYAQRLLQGLMMNQMNTDAASRLDATARERQLADAARTRGFAVEDAIRDRGYSVEDRDLLAQNKIDVKDAGLGTGPFQGTSPYAQNSNILLNGDPSTPVYRAAYNKMATSKNTLDPNTGQMVSVSPDMSAFRPPTGAPTNTAPQGQTPGQPSISVTEGQGRTKPYPEFQSKSAGFYNRMMDANSEIDNLFAGKDGKQGTPDDLKIEDVYNWREYASDNVPFIGNALTSDNFQRAQQAQRNWVSANLRLESGAAIPPEEMEMEFKKYFPSYGDGDAVIQQKARARKKVEQNMRTQSQGAYESMYGAGKNTPPSDTPQPPSGFKVVN